MNYLFLDQISFWNTWLPAILGFLCILIYVLRGKTMQTVDPTMMLFTLLLSLMLLFVITNVIASFIFDAITRKPYQYLAINIIYWFGIFVTSFFISSVGSQMGDIK